MVIVATRNGIKTVTTAASRWMFQTNDTDSKRTNTKKKREKGKGQEHKIQNKQNRSNKKHDDEDRGEEPHEKESTREAESEKGDVHDGDDVEPTLCTTDLVKRAAEASETGYMLDRALIPQQVSRPPPGGLRVYIPHRTDSPAPTPSLLVDLSALGREGVFVLRVDGGVGNLFPPSS